jgi:hypothetical protein
MVTIRIIIVNRRSSKKGASMQQSIRRRLGSEPKQEQPHRANVLYPFVDTLQTIRVATFRSQRPSLLVTVAALAVFYDHFVAVQPFTPYTTTGEYTGSSR